MSDSIYVYKITAPSGKAYVGVTKNMKTRMTAHKASSMLIGDAIRKYGDQMQYDILCACEDRNHASKIEVGLIKSFNTKYPNGYNLTDGGLGTGGRVEIMKK